jgi:FkbM family methyltransferase
MNFKARLRAHPQAYRMLQRIYVLSRFVAGRPHEIDFAAFRFLEGDGILLDVGANSGASAMSFRLYRPGNRILSIEPLRMHIVDLQIASRIVGKMEWMSCAAGDEPGLLTLHVPYYEDVPLSKLASLIPEEVTVHSAAVWYELGDDIDQSKFEVRRQHTAVVRLDDLGLSPSFIKIDVQGFEMQVLKGLQKTLDAHRPVLLLEVGGDWRMIQHVREQGYVAFHYAHPVLQPFTGQKGANLFLLPREHALVDETAEEADRDFSPPAPGRFARGYQRAAWAAAQRSAPN